MSTPDTLPTIALAGPTASGKTAGALALAAVLGKQGRPVEIISVDSALVYRGMDIGTAKPSPDERAAVPHHLIDIRDPLQAYSAAEFVQDATRLIAEIRARGALPLLVGGTMLYFKALFDGIDDMPAADPEVRAKIEAQAAEQGWPALHAELARVDPVTAARLAPGDSQRIQRALEVWHVSGQPLSSFHTIKKVADNTNNTGASALFPWNPTTGHGCTSASPSVLTPCWPVASLTRSRPCAHAATCTPTCPRCAAWATGRCGKNSTSRLAAPLARR